MNEIKRLLTTIVGEKLIEKEKDEDREKYKNTFQENKNVSRSSSTIDQHAINDEEQQKPYLKKNVKKRFGRVDHSKVVRSHFS